MELKVLFVIIVCYCPLIANTKAQCLIESPLDTTVRPKFFRNTTTQTALISYHDRYLYLEDNEEIIGHCVTSFRNLRNGNSQITIYCKNRQIAIHDYNYGRYNPSSRILECVPGQTLGKCSIVSTPNRVVRPKFFKKIGTRTIQISPEVISIKHDQVITARCDTKFKSPNHESSDLTLFCLNGRIVTLGHPFAMSTPSLECESLHWNMYESETQFAWCPSPMASYILARPWLNNDYEYLAGICYNIEEMSFKSLYYSAKPQFAKDLSPDMLKTYKPTMAISDINTNFISKRTYMYDNLQFEKWIKFANYKNESIVQNSKLYHDMLQQFEKLLSIDWWSGLKLGNWKFYEEELARHIAYDANEYDILAGISEAVAVPISREGCNRNLTMTELVDSANMKLPFYIWNYLKSLKNYSDEVVVIGVNSPFYDFYDEKDIVFCNDICHQLDWLENIYTTFRYRPMGVIFCCSVDEVIASERLDGFAKHEVLIPPDTTTVDSVDTADDSSYITDKVDELSTINYDATTEDDYTTVEYVSEEYSWRRRYGWD